MQLDNIKFVQQEDFGAVPDQITVTMTASELIFLAKLLGQQSDNMAELVVRGGAVLGSAIYNCLTTEVANCFFPDGIDEMARRVMP